MRIKVGVYLTVKKLVDYIDEHWRPKPHTSFGAKANFAKANGMSPQQVTNMIATNDFIAFRNTLYRKTATKHIIIDGINYVKVRKLPKK